MAKILPASFPALSLDELQVGAPIRASQFKALFERSHFLFALQRGRAQGWEWEYESVSDTDFANSITDAPDLGDYQPILRPQRPLAGDVVRVGMKVYGANYELNAQIYALDTGTFSATFVDTITLFPVSLSLAWSSVDVDIDLVDITDSGGRLMPLVFFFECVGVRNSIANAFIYRIQPFEAGLAELTASDLP